MFGTALRYTLPVLSLTAIAAAFLRARRHQPLPSWSRYALVSVAALPLAASGTLHLLRPGAFLPLLPPWVPERLLVVSLTGLPELCGACGLFFAETRRQAAGWLTVLMIVIFPCNIYVAGERVQGLLMPGVLARTALQAGYIVLLLIAGYGWPRYRRPDAACLPV